jgi:hypothetical protein
VQAARINAANEVQTQAPCKYTTLALVPRVASDGPRYVIKQMNSKRMVIQINGDRYFNM